ncbi:MAG: hypothetical protein QF662_05550, partial [Phycisphaerae bacterium]|nr:hypothetical protein [Phycisphaerae bacterium]
MKTSQVVIGLLVIAQLLSAGCQPAQYTTPERYREGLVIVLGGAGGITTAPQQMRAGLDAGGVPYAIEVYHWSSGSILSDQQDIERNRRLSARLARKIEA